MNEPTAEEIDREAFAFAGPGPYHPKIAEQIRDIALARLLEEK